MGTVDGAAAAAALLIGISVLAELLAIVSGRIGYQKLMSATAIFSGLSGSLLLAIHTFNYASAAILFIETYRSINLVRLISRRMHYRYLISSFKSSSYYLISAQLAVFLFYGLWRNFNLGEHLVGIVAACLVVIFLASLLIFYTTFTALIRFRRFSIGGHIKRDELPTVSVLVPARNETAELTSCLDAILASRYPKLEVIVLDDCSQDKTPEVIKGLAHDGVRFISGKPTPDDWLAKNFAYHQLADEATGELLLFMGVDVRLTDDSIGLLVEELTGTNSQMLSVLPKRLGQSLVGALVQPMRYWWQIAIPARLRGHPPALSTCWMISADYLKNHGSFSSCKRAIEPEAILASSGQDYRFVWADNRIGINTIKSISEQISTAVRSRYPQLHKKPERVMTVGLFEIAVLCMPFVVAVAGIFYNFDGFTWPLMVSASILLTLSNILITSITNPRIWPLSLINFPLIAFTELWLLNYSMYKYEFSEVEWKGRNICLPLMHVYPSLPLLREK